MSVPRTDSEAQSKALKNGEKNSRSPESSLAASRPIGLFVDESQGPLTQLARLRRCAAAGGKKVPMLSTRKPCSLAHGSTTCVSARAFSPLTQKRGGTETELWKIQLRSSFSLG